MPTNLCYPVRMPRHRELDARESRVVGIADLTTGKVVLADGTTTEQFAAGIASAIGRLSRPVEIIDSETGAVTYEHTVNLTGEGE